MISILIILFEFGFGNMKDFSDIIGVYWFIASIVIFDLPIIITTIKDLDYENSNSIELQIFYSVFPFAVDILFILHILNYY